MVVLITKIYIFLSYIASIFKGVDIDVGIERMRLVHLRVNVNQQNLDA